MSFALNGYPVIRSELHDDGRSTVACDLGTRAAHRYVVATWWPALGKTWSNGDYVNSRAAMHRAFDELAIVRRKVAK